MLFYILNSTKVLRDIFYCQSSGDLEAGIHYLEANGEPSHEEDGSRKHEEGNDDMDPENDTILRWTQICKGGMTKVRRVESSPS